MSQGHEQPYLLSTQHMACPNYMPDSVFWVLLPPAAQGQGARHPGPAVAYVVLHGVHFIDKSRCFWLSGDRRVICGLRATLAPIGHLGAMGEGS